MRTFLSSLAVGLVAGIVGAVFTLQIVEQEDERPLDVALDGRVAALEAALLESSQASSVAPRRDGPTKRELDSIRDRLRALENVGSKQRRGELEASEAATTKAKEETEAVVERVYEQLRTKQLEERRERSRKWKRQAIRKAGERAVERASTVAKQVSLDEGQTQSLARAFERLETTNWDHLPAIKNESSSVEDRLAALEGLRRNIDDFASDVRSFMTAEQVEQFATLENEDGKGSSPLEVPDWLEEMEQELREGR